MANRKHTPGPWMVEGDCVRDRLGLRVANCYADWKPDFRVEADAQLIAAAPELLAMAKLLERTVLYEIKRSEQSGDDESARLKGFTLHQVRAAIAKAEPARAQA